MLNDGDTFEHKNRTFTVRFPHDDVMGAPWKEHDGHGPVSDWTHRAKLPSERVVSQDGGSFRYYDVAEAIRTAKSDQWGLDDEATVKLAERLGRVPTAGDIAVEAVERDFQFLRAWCNDEWHWIGVVVEHAESGESESLWGIESCAGDYLAEVARELADEIAARLDSAMAAEIAESRPDMTMES